MAGKLISIRVNVTPELTNSPGRPDNIQKKELEVIMIPIRHLLWILLVLVNFSIQISYFYKDQNNRLFLGKKITTPALLFGSLVLVLLSEPPLPWIPMVIFTLMGLGELGIEGSSVVESTGRGKEGNKTERIIVTAAGIIFLFVNLFLGVVLIIGKPVPSILISTAISLLFYGFMNFSLSRIFDLSREMRKQIRIYSFSLVVLMTGTLTDLFQGLSQLGLAAALLTVSDTLVLTRMGADFDKKSRKGFYTLLVFLVVILVLYYLYMAVLIRSSLSLK